MTQYDTPPIGPLRIEFEPDGESQHPEGPKLTRRMSDLFGLLAAEAMRADAALGDDPVIYTVASSPVPEMTRELPRSITTIQPGTVGGEFSTVLRLRRN